MQIDARALVGTSTMSATRTASREAVSPWGGVSITMTLEPARLARSTVLNRRTGGQVMTSGRNSPRQSPQAAAVAWGSVSITWT
ncbi:hypothetical protein MBENS4_3942 [Novosphingobium sp. MBES04]|nr:hypothetical protein MBENS4_3942 [Novosphingobium sp. MBES04]